MTASLVLAAVVAVAAVLLVAVPFLRDPTPREDRLREPREADKRRLALAEERDRVRELLSRSHDRQLADEPTGSEPALIDF